MPSAVFSDEPDVEVTRTTGIPVELSNTDAPVIEIILDADPDVSLESNDALLGVVGPAAPSPAPIIEVVPAGAEPVLDVILEEQAVVDISAVGVQGAQGEIGVPGPIGPQGPQGAPGVSGVGASVSFIFQTPSTVWNLPHNLGRKYVDVVTIDQNDEEIFGDVVFVDESNARVEWYYATGGYATVST
jgi:hypothetical protein